MADEPQPQPVPLSAPPSRLNGTPLSDHRANILGAKNGMELLWLLPLHLNARLVVEFGSGTGISASLIGSALKQVDGQLRSVDIVDQPAARKRVAEYGLDNVTFHTMDALEFCRRFHGDVDMVFEDSAHTYEVTYGVLSAMAPRVRPGGLMVVHDVGNHEVAQAMDDFARHGDWVYAIDYAGVGLAILCRAPRRGGVPR